MANSNIEWTNETWNPVTGCTKISSGCKNCYAEKFAKRLKAMKNKRYKNGFSVTLHWDKIEDPLKWRKPRFVFVNSMSDLFHKKVPLKFIKSVFYTIKKADNHIFQILTKRSSRLKQVAGDLDWPENLWIGVSVENQDNINRIEDLRQVPSEVKFISFEPLIGPITNFSLDKINWVIVGGESGTKARPIKASWVRIIRDRCQQEEIPFFFKQWGGRTPKAGGRTLDGKIWDEYPEHDIV
ncbi:MAG: DUF5131 family protein [Halanaerobiales bacterium]